MEGSSSSPDHNQTQGIRSLMDQAGRLLDSAVDQLKTPRKINTTGKASTTSSTTTPGSAQKKQESIEFPASHDVTTSEHSTRRILSYGTKKNQHDDGDASEEDESYVTDRYTQSTRRLSKRRGLFGIVVMLCIYASLGAGTGCMLVAHGNVLDRAIPRDIQRIGHTVVEFYDRVVPETYREIVRPLPGYVYRDVCVKHVNPAVHGIRQWIHQTRTFVSSLSVDHTLKTLTTSAKQGMQSGMVVYRKNTKDIQEYIYRHIGRMDPFWMRKKHQGSALVAVLGDGVPTFVMRGVIEPIIVMISVILGGCIALWVVLEMFVFSSTRRRT